MKKVFIGALALVLTAGAAQAQVKDSTQKHKAQKEWRHKQGDIGFAQLNLTDAQKTQLKSIREKRKADMKALKANENITVKEWKARKQAIQDKYKAQFQSVLTQEQKDKMAKMEVRHRKGQKGHGMKDQMRNRDGQAFKGGKGARGQRPDMAKMAQQLNLTDAQKTQLQKLRADFRTKADAIRSNTSLTKEQKKEQFQALAKQQKEQMKSVLTKEQIEKMESFRKERANRIS
jgi:Spy/CpxP family protein refolding chaperone